MFGVSVYTNEGDRKRVRQRETKRREHVREYSYLEIAKDRYSY